jgi:ABC-2 type transport system ATP-binding protein
VIKLTNLQKLHDQNTVIDIPSLHIKGGEIAALVGPMDSSKDALFQLLTGSTLPTKGSVLLAGVDPYHDRKNFSRMVGVLFAQDTLYKRMSVIENLRFYSRLYRLPDSRPTEVLEQVGLADQASVNTEKLTAGLSRRLALGRAILNHPQVLLLADPFTGCELASVRLIVQVVREQANSGAAVLVFAQDTANLEGFCDRVFYLDQGRIGELPETRGEQTRQRPFMVPARTEEKIILVDPADILYAFAQEDRTYLQTSSGRLPTQFTLAELEKRLARSGFFRAHRGFLVNLQQIKEVIPYTRDSFSLRLKDVDGTTIPLSKSAERELRDLLGY